MLCGRWSQMLLKIILVSAGTTLVVAMTIPAGFSGMSVRWFRVSQTTNHRARLSPIQGGAITCTLDPCSAVCNGVYGACVMEGMVCMVPVCGRGWCAMVPV